MGDVFLLGAGFSRAISKSLKLSAYDALPLLRELSSAIRQRVELPANVLALGDNLALWLTYLSRPQL